MALYDPTNDDHPTEGWSTSLKYYKKAISYFMPNHRMQWNKLEKSGNPTCLDEVNDLISVVMKKEVRKQGKPTQADRPFEKPDFKQKMEILSSFPNFDHKCHYTTMGKFQFHLIARLDVTCQVKKDTLVPCVQFPFALM
eukprot:8407033-Ditylum_brightwellii.AAC.1